MHIVSGLGLEERQKLEQRIYIISFLSQKSALGLAINVALNFQAVKGLKPLFRVLF